MPVAALAPLAPDPTAPVPAGMNTDVVVPAVPLVEFETDATRDETLLLRDAMADESVAADVMVAELEIERALVALVAEPPDRVNSPL